MKSPPAPVRVVEPARFSDILIRLTREGPPRLYLGEVLEAFGERGVAALMLLFSLINFIPLPPGGTTITGAPLLFLSIDLAIGRENRWLPGKLLGKSIQRASFRKGIGWLIPVIAFFENLSRPRMTWLTSGFSQGLIGLTCFLLSIILVLPIPLGNIAPAVTMALFSLGVMQRDGFVVILGWLSAAISFGLLVFIWRVVWKTVAGLWDQLTGLSLPIP